MHEGVDVVGLGLVGEFEVRHFWNHQHLRTNGDLVVPRHYKRLAACAGGHHALAINRGGDVVVGEEHGLVSHVARSAVAIHGPHDDLLLSAFSLEHGLFRVNLEVHHLGSARRITRCPGFEPADDSFIKRTFLAIQFTPSMRHTAGALFEQQAVVRQCEVDAAAEVFASNSVVITIGIKTKQR